MDYSLIIPAFIAGILMFLAPCTLPLVPGYLGFISGTSFGDLDDPAKAKGVRKKIIKNGLLYVTGFTIVFVFFGTIFGLGGSALAHYKIILTRIAGMFVMLFGLYMIGVSKIAWLQFLNFERHLSLTKHLKPGKPSSSLIFGAAFALGWTPCIGPILGSILLLASTSETVGQGALLLFIFSLGLAVPFMILATSIGATTSLIKKLDKYLGGVTIIGGIFLVFLGYLLTTNSLSAWFKVFYTLLEFINYDALLNYL